VVSERFSNTVSRDNLTKVYASHTFKGGYTYQNIFFGSTQPPYARGEYYWDGRYTSLVNSTDTSTARAHFLLAQIPSLVPGGVDYLGGMHDLRVSRSATSTRSRPTMARTPRTAGASTTS
jgi:hypothetical protein